MYRVLDCFEMSSYDSLTYVGGTCTHWWYTTGCSLITFNRFKPNLDRLECPIMEHLNISPMRTGASCALFNFSIPSSESCLAYERHSVFVG